MPYFRRAIVSWSLVVILPVLAFGGPCPVVSLSYCTYLGGSGYEQGNCIAVDRTAHRFIVAGKTASEDFPATPDAFDEDYNSPPYAPDAYVSSFDVDDRSLICSTYFGGSGGEDVKALALDSAGNVFIAGQSDSIDLPITTGASDRPLGGYFFGYVVSLTRDFDAVRWSTYAGSDACALLYDPEGYVYVGSHVSQMSGSCDFAHAPGTSAVIFKLDADDGSLVWCGSVGDGFITSLQLAGDGSLIVAGTTQGTIALSEDAYDTTRDGLSDLFIIKLDKERGALEWGTYLGGSDLDIGIDIAVGRAGQVLFAAGTESEDFPLSQAGWGTQYRGGSDVVIGAISGDGVSLLWSRDIGGTGFDGAEIYYDKPNLVSCPGNSYT